MYGDEPGNANSVLPIVSLLDPNVKTGEANTRNYSVDYR